MIWLIFMAWLEIQFYYILCYVREEKPFHMLARSATNIVNSCRGFQYNKVGDARRKS